MGVEDRAAGCPDGTFARNGQPIGDRRPVPAHRDPDDLAAVRPAVAGKAAEAHVHVAVAERQGRPLLVGERAVAGEIDAA